MMLKEDGSRCTTSEENAEVFHTHFEKLYNRPAVYNADILELLEQHPLNEAAGRSPDHDEIRKAIHRLKNKAPGSSELTPRHLPVTHIVSNTFVTLLLKSGRMKSVPGNGIQVNW